MSPLRLVHLHNAHRGLTLQRRAVCRVIHALDAAFRPTAADLPHLTTAARSRARRLLQAEGVAGFSLVPEGELSLAFFTDAALAELHGDFLADPSTTDVITFEGESAFGTAGEICVSADTAAAFARKNGHDFSSELTLYLVHGWLHLAGYDDLQPAKKRRMRAAEARAMAMLRAGDVVPCFTLRTPRTRSRAVFASAQTVQEVFAMPSPPRHRGIF